MLPYALLQVFNSAIPVSCLGTVSYTSSMRFTVHGLRITTLLLLDLLVLWQLIGSSWIFNLLLAQAEPSNLTTQSSQLVMVLAKNWDSNEAKLSRFERDSQSAAWKQVGETWPVAIGFRGLAWGIGLHPQQQLHGPLMDEGDQRSPAGVFSISSVFGLLKPSEVGPLKLPYHQSEKSDICVDDPQSKYYNQIIGRNKLAEADWHSAEPMASGDPAYKLGLIFDQNPAPTTPRRGSCIFLHIGPSSGGTFGCTTLGEDKLREILYWLEASKHPLFVQLPEQVYRYAKIVWGLP